MAAQVPQSTSTSNGRRFSSRKVLTTLGRLALTVPQLVLVLAVQVPAIVLEFASEGSRRALRLSRLL